MPVVMTGSPGGTMGGNSGAHFGSGLSGLTTSPTFSPNLEKWTVRHEEDKNVTKERKESYNELSRKCLDRSSYKEKTLGAKKQAANDAFVQRQQQLAEAEAAEKKRMALARKEALVKPTLGDPMLGTATNRKQIESQSVLDEDSVARWLWPTEKREKFFEVHGVGAEHEEAMLTLPPNASADTVLAYVDTIVGNSRDLTAKAVETRKHKDAEMEAKMESEKKEREAMADARRSFLIKKAKDETAAAVSRSRAVKKEMAEETKTQRKEDTEKAQKRFEKGQAQRKTNLETLIFAETDDLRSEAEIANERREGTSMNKGGRNDFRNAMLEGSDATKEAFM